jgi:pyroglutamyl-peptidase
MRLLLTGFEPFGGSSVNPSQQIVQAVQQQRFAGLELRTAILPVDGATAPAAVIAAVQAQRPAVVICLGQATGRAVLSIERVAVNLLDYRIPDNAGKLIEDEPVVAGGPAAYFVTLPVRAMLVAVKAADVPVELSLSAGTFLCNQVLYALLHHIAVNTLAVRAGFIHVPSLPEQAATSARVTPSMSLDTMVRGVEAALAACVA